MITLSCTWQIYALSDRLLVLCLCLLQAVKLTSIKAQLPYDYYSIGICKPEEIKYKSENLGISLCILLFTVVTLNCKL